MAISVPQYWQPSVDMRGLTSMRIGGTADYLVKALNMEELQETLQLASERDLPIKVLGGGSNLIFSDAGLRGVLVQPYFPQIAKLTDEEAAKCEPYVAEMETYAKSGRYLAEDRPEFLKLEERAAAGATGEPVLVEMGAGVPWGQAVAWTLQNRLSGLQYFARIPCQVGGATYNNIHAERRLLSERICMVKALDRVTGVIRTYGPSELEFGYDDSRFHRSGEIILSVVFRLDPVDAEANMANQQLYIDWTKQKTKVQPSGPNCGSVFKNLSPEEAEAHGQVAAAWYVDQCGFKGATEGDVQVYPGHANFIVNRGQGRQADFIALVQRIRSAVRERFGIWLEPEAECVDQLGAPIAWEKSGSAAAS